MSDVYFVIWNWRCSFVRNRKTNYYKLNGLFCFCQRWITSKISRQREPFSALKELQFMKWPSKHKLIQCVNLLLTTFPSQVYCNNFVWGKGKIWNLSLIVTLVIKKPLQPTIVHNLINDLPKEIISLLFRLLCENHFWIVAKIFNNGFLWKMTTMKKF